MTDLLFAQEVYDLIGAAIEVHRNLGAGFLEAVYQEALEMELCARKIPFEPQKVLHVNYKGQILKKYYIADGVAFGKIVVELKAQNALSSVDQSQVINCLKASGLRVGVLINFGSRTRLEWKRFIV